MLPGDEIDTAGEEFTFIVVLLEPVQPSVVPVTEYVVLTEGETLMDAVVAPVDQRYVAAPEAVRVAEAPSQILPGDDMETTGLRFTVTVTLELPEHPAVVPVTE